MQRNRTNKPIRLGAMAPVRNRKSDAPTYQQLLTKHGFLPRGANIAEAWSCWQKVCEDSEVRTLAQDIEQPKHRIMASVTSGYHHVGKVLSMLSDRQMTALKQRIEIPRT
jgi:hypothetical protein